MLYAYNKDQNSLSKCQPTEFKAKGLLERADMEKWVEDDPRILGEELMVVTTEYDGFDKTNERLDVLVLDKKGNLVVVELKRDDSGKNVDLQALKYAAYCSSLTLDDVADIHSAYRARKGEKLDREQAATAIRVFLDDEGFEEFSAKPRIMLVSRAYRPEVTASVQWLRTFEMDISCIKWDVYELPDGSIVIDTSVLVPQPETKDFEMRVQRKEMAEHAMSQTRKDTLAFFSRCTELLNERRPGTYPAPRNQSYYQVTSPLAGVHFEWGFHGRPRSSFGCELHFEKSTAEANHELIDVVANDVPTLEAQLGGEVSIEREWGSRWSRIYVETDLIDMSDEQAEWAVETVLTFMAVFTPTLEKLAQGSSS